VISTVADLFLGRRFRWLQYVLTGAMMLTLLIAPFFNLLKVNWRRKKTKALYLLSSAVVRDCDDRAECIILRGNSKDILPVTGVRDLVSNHAALLGISGFVKALVGTETDGQGD